MIAFNQDKSYRFKVRSLIHKGIINFAGNKKLKIFGLLNCNSGKRMNADNRVFFETETEAGLHGYRPCAHCMKEKYELWKTAHK